MPFDISWRRGRWSCRSIRLLAALVLALASVGCARTELVYRNADWLIERYGEQAVAMDGDQAERWRPTLVAVLQRHHDEALPRVIGYLDATALAVDAIAEPQAAACLVDAAIALYRQHARLAVDLAVPVLLELDADQVRHLAAYLAEHEVEARARYLPPDPARREAARAERFIEGIERWTGPLGNGQRRHAGAALARMPDLTEDWLAYRAGQTTGLIQRLEAGTDEPTLRAYLTAWWVDWDGQPAGYAARWEASWAAFTAYLAELAASLTDRQRTHLVEKLRSIRSDLAAVHEPASGAAAASADWPPCAASWVGSTAPEQAAPAGDEAG
jgi:hypothetical protein